MNQNELYHHGILGQKWGVRRYQNEDGTLTNAGRNRYQSGEASSISSRKGLQRRLNDVDQAMAFNKRDHREASARKEFYDKKTQKQLQKKNPNQDKIDKYKAKSAENESQMKRAAQNIQKGKSECDRLVKMAEEKGYTVKSSETARCTDRGKDVLANYASVFLTFSAAGLVGAPFAMAYVTTNYDRGTAYKVKKPKNE